LTEANLASIAFCEQVFDHVYGMARIRLNGEMVGFDAERNEIFVNQYVGNATWMPAGEFLNNLSSSEIHTLRHLPPWNGSNANELTCALMDAVSGAIQRYRKEIVDYLFYECIRNGEVARYKTDQNG